MPKYVIEREIPDAGKLTAEVYKLMKIALLGNGKTGGKVVQLHNDVTVFDTKNSPTVEILPKRSSTFIYFRSRDLVRRNSFSLYRKFCFPLN